MLDKDFGKASDRIMHIMRYALAKFWYHGTSKRSISLINWNTGPIKQTGQSKAILDAMIKAGLISKIKISGVQEGGLSFDRDSRADLKNFMDNSQLSGKIEKLYRLLLAD
ncbi:MAG: hypothetical protein OXC62_12300 [Aestuariivita sp.]|nr:hypothetical protein [Aestuariivita sp.]